MNQDQLLAIGDRIVGQARPGEQIEVVVSAERETDVKVFDGQVESLSVAESAGVGIRVVLGTRQGFAWAGTLEESVVADTLVQARDNAAYATEDEFVGLAEPDGVDYASLSLWDDALASMEVEAKVALALALEAATRAADPRIVAVETAEYGDFLATGAIVSSTGLRAVGAETGCSLVTYAIAEADGDTQTGFGYSLGRGPEPLSPDLAAADAAARATRLLGATKPPSRRTTVVLDPWVTAQLLGVLGSTLTGEAVQKGRSPFAERLGDQIAATHLTLVDDPTVIEAFTATRVDGEGLATRRNVLIDRGELSSFVHNAYTGRRAGAASTGSAVRRGITGTPGVGCQALALTPGDRPPAELLAGIDDGIYVQDVAGLHSGVNPVSGDFSTGAEGLRIAGGALGEPCREFTIASTLQRLLTDVRAVGSDLTWLPMSAAGVTLVVDEVTVSGT